MTGILTPFRGKLYRSKVEAAWAKFFYVRKIEALHEPLFVPANHNTPGYLPDFFFPATLRWGEVKAAYEFEPFELFKSASLVLRYGNPCVLLCGQPAEGPHRVIEKVAEEFNDFQFRARDSRIVHGGKTINLDDFIEYSETEFI